MKPLSDLYIIVDFHNAPNTIRPTFSVIKTILDKKLNKTAPGCGCLPIHDHCAPHKVKSDALISHPHMAAVAAR